MNEARDLSMSLAQEFHGAVERYESIEVNEASLDTFRSRESAAVLAPSTSAGVRELFAPGLSGEPPVRVLTYPETAAELALPVILWFHGGGLVGGSADIPSALLTASRARGWAVVSVDYRLSPEHPYPAAVRDGLAAVEWIGASAGEFGFDPSNVIVAGRSAGGCIAATVAHELGRDRCRALSLIAPMLDDRTGSSVDPGPQYGQFVWSRASNAFGWRSYLGDSLFYSGELARAVPARFDDLARMPPTFIGVGMLDLFYLEDLKLAERLKAAGVSTRVEVVPGAMHGFDLIPEGSRLAADFRKGWIESLATLIGRDEE